MADNAKITQKNAVERVIGTPFKAGNPGRPPGANKLTKTVKETVLDVFNQLQEDPNHSLLMFAQKHPRDFYAIAAKLIPTEISGKLVTTINVVETQAAGCLPMEVNGN